MTSDPPESDSAIASAFANVARDEEGYLLKPEDWNAQIAELCARICNIELSDTHWSLVYFIRHYFETNQRVPQTRHVLKIIAAEAAHHGISSRRYLHVLFPYGSGQQACKIAGMRKPLKLMLDV